MAKTRKLKKSNKTTRKVKLMSQIKKLEAKHEKIQDQMVKAQLTASAAIDRADKAGREYSANDQKLIDKGFKYEYLAIKSAEKIGKLKNQIKKL
jgi:hypothetical protein